ncbi:MAG: hypothetical protein ACO32O_07815 [Ilumatobacteraceae bacterium]
MPPFVHTTQLRVFIDPDLLQYGEMWAATGTWNDNFGAAHADIVRVAGGVVTDLKRIGHPDVHDVTAWASVDLH